MRTLNKLNVLLWIAVVLCIFGVLLITASFFVPPLGVLDSSVIVAYGETLTFVGSIVGIDYNYKSKIKLKD